jgi:general stress protein CsbA
MCKSWCEAIIAVVILVVAFAFWNTTYAQWIIGIAAAVLLIHSFTYKKCFSGRHMEDTKRKK